MLIGIDASRAAYAQRTGTENYSLFLIRALLEQDEQNSYRLYFCQPPAQDLFALRPNVQIRVMPFARLWTHLRLSWEMVTAPPDVLFVPAHVLPLWHPRRSLVTVHDLGYLHYPEAHTPWARQYLQWSTAFNVRAATHVIADSEATKSDLIEHCQALAERIHVVYPGYAPIFVPVQDNARLNSLRERYAIHAPYFVHVGTLQPRKNLVRLLEAFAVVVQGGRDVHLVITGKKGWRYEPLFARVQQLRLEDRVHFTGYLPQEDLPALITGARAFVLPSLAFRATLPICARLSWLWSASRVFGVTILWLPPKRPSIANCWSAWQSALAPCANFRQTTPEPRRSGNPAAAARRRERPSRARGLSRFFPACGELSRAAQSTSLRKTTFSPTMPR